MVEVSSGSCKNCFQVFQDKKIESGPENLISHFGFKAEDAEQK
jgi:hypothetical protein